MKTTFKTRLTTLWLVTLMVVLVGVGVTTLAFMALGLGRANPSQSQLLYISRTVTTEQGQTATLFIHDLRADVRYPLVRDFLGWGSDATWSPDGKRIAYSAFEAGAVRRNLHIYDLRSGESQRVTGGTIVTDHNSPSWSPDGRYLAYHAVNPATGSLDIYVHDLQTDEVHLAYAGHGSDLAPAWSPDGRTLVIQSEQAPRWTYNLLLLDVTTWRRSRLTDTAAADFNPQWSPDGREIAFVRSQTNPQGDAYSLYVITVNTGELRHLRTLHSERVPDVAWSPGGELIAITLQAQAEQQVYTLRASSGSDLRQRSSGPPGHRRPHWRPG